MKKRLWLCLAIAFWLAVWQAASMIIDREILLVSPLKALSTFWGMLGEKSFYLSVSGSMGRIVVGFIIGSVSGVALAGAARLFMPLRMLFLPVMAAIKATPVASFVILALIWVSSKNLSVLMSLLIVLPVIYSNVLDGLDRADAKLVEMASVFRVPFWGRVRAIYAPAAYPYLLTSVRLSLGMCWKAGIAAEVIAQPVNSIGSALQRAKVFFSTPELFAWTIAIVIISVLFEKAALLLIRLAGAKTGG